MPETTVLHEALERAIGPGPDGPELATLLDHGHRAVRRRRGGAAATLALAVMATAGVVYGVDGATPSSSSPVGPATTGPRAATGRLDETLHGREQVWDASERRLAAQHGLSLEPDASIVFPADVVVVRHVDDALHRAPEEESVGYVVREHGEEIWYLGRVRTTGGAQSTGHLVIGRPGVDAPTFEDWLGQQASA